MGLICDQPTGSIVENSCFIYPWFIFVSSAPYSLLSLFRGSQLLLLVLHQALKKQNVFPPWQDCDGKGPLFHIIHDVLMELLHNICLMQLLIQDEKFSVKSRAMWGKQQRDTADYYLMIIKNKALITVYSQIWWDQLGCYTNNSIQDTQVAWQWIWTASPLTWAAKRRNVIFCMEKKKTGGKA